MSSFRRYVKMAVKPNDETLTWRESIYHLPPLRMGKRYMSKSSSGSSSESGISSSESRKYIISPLLDSSVSDIPVETGPISYLLSVRDFRPS